MKVTFDIKTIKIEIEASDDALTGFTSRSWTLTSASLLEAEEPTAEEPTAEEPTAEEPTAEEPTAEEPTAEEPTAEEPTAEEPTAEEPTAEEPTAEEPTAEEPTAEEPTAEEDTSQQAALDALTEAEGKLADLDAAGIRALVLTCCKAVPIADLMPHIEEATGAKKATEIDPDKYGALIKTLTTQVMSYCG